MDNAKFVEWLYSKSVCESALKWLSLRNFNEACSECPRVEWLVWLAIKAGLTTKAMTSIACSYLKEVFADVLVLDQGITDALYVGEIWARATVSVQQVNSAYSGLFHSGMISGRATDSTQRNIVCSVFYIINLVESALHGELAHGKHNHDHQLYFICNVFNSIECAEMQSVDVKTVISDKPYPITEYVRNKISIDAIKEFVKQQSTRSASS